MSFGTHLQDEQQERHTKSGYLIVAISILFLLLIVRLFYIQIVQGQLNIRLSKENSMRLKVIVPPRGRILDRNGVVLARNRPSYSICVLPYKLKNRKLIIQNLCQIKDSTGSSVFDSTDLTNAIHRAAFRRFEATRLKEDVSVELMSIIEEHSMELPGIIVETESRREYTMGPDAFHLLGYMGEIPEEKFDSLKTKGYFYGDLIGKDGIEKQYETVMRGRCGQEYIEVNAYGKSLGPIPNMPRIDPVPGNDLYLGLDARLQAVAAKSFPDSLRGAVVAIDPRNGEVLLMYSNPGVDPNIFSLSTSARSKNWQTIVMDPSLPLNNRATCGTYTPGSTFKLVTTLAGLESGKIDKNSFFPSPCVGAYRIGSRIAHCWDLKGHGYLNMIDAVAKSCDVYFYQAGLKLGDVLINQYAAELGLGQKTGIDLPTERLGWLSGEEAYNKRWQKRGWRWTKGLVLDLAIGQGQVVTPVQLALMVGGLGQGSSIFVPHVVKEERNSDGIVLNEHKSSVLHNLNFSAEVLTVQKDALISVMRAGGTGGRAVVQGIQVGGKTGSAENVKGEKTTALFVGCAPVENPVIAISVVLEKAGHGGSVAAPIAGDVMRYYFAHTEEGRRIVRQYNPGIDTIPSLRAKIWPDDSIKPVLTTVVADSLKAKNKIDSALVNKDLLAKNKTASDKQINKVIKRDSTKTDSSKVIHPVVKPAMKPDSAKAKTVSKPIDSTQAIKAITTQESTTQVQGQ